MRDQDLVRWRYDLESDQVERKASFAHPDRICQAVCAFANGLPNHRSAGVVLVGVNDDGSCAALPITDDLLQQLAGLRTDHEILPFPSIEVHRRTIDGCEAALVLVHPSEAPPVRYRGRVWIRVGPRRAIATPEEERRLNEKRRAGDLPFDIRPLPSAALDDLDEDLFRRVYLSAALPAEVLRQNQRSAAEQLAAMRFASPDGVPTALGLLVAGKDPLQFLPGAYVQFLRIDGAELIDPVKDRMEITGALPDLLRQLDDKLKAQISVAVDPRSAPEVTRADYPIAALRQLAFNAILHRSYEGTNAPVRIYWFDDRIEFQNPGGPFGQVSRQNFGAPGVTDYRNPHLAEAMRNLGYVQRFGMGIPIARGELAKNGNPPLEFQVEDAHVLATVRKRQ